MELHILLAGVEFGPYTDDQARELLGEGFLSETDPAKRLDETDWLPLSDVLAQSHAETAPLEEPKAEISAGEEELAPPITEAPEEEAAAESSTEFTWPTEERHEEFAAQETSAAENIEVPTPETEPSVEASPTFSEATDEPAASIADEEPEPIKMPSEQPEKSSEAVRTTASSRVRRQLTEAEKTSFLLPLTRQLPDVAAKSKSPAPVAPASVTTAPSPGRAVPTPITLAPASTSATPIISTIPLLQVSLPAKAKKAMRTGSLLVQEALRAARDQKNILSPSEAPPPTAPVRSIPPAPSVTPAPVAVSSPQAPAAAPESEETFSAASRRKPQLVLRGREETQTLPTPPPAAPAPVSSSAPAAPANPATVQRKAIRLTGRITLPGLAPKPELPQSQSPSLSGPLVVTRPARTGTASKGQPTRPLTSREKSSFLIGQIARPADIAREEIAAEAAETSVAPIAEEKKIEELPAPSLEEEFEPAHDLTQAAGEETVAAEEPAATETVPGSVTALLQAAGTDTVAEPTDTGALPAIEPSDADLTASGRLISSGEMAERRSLKITGPLRHPAPRTPIRLSSPSKPGESSRLPYPSGERISTSSLPLPEAPAEPTPLPPAPEESLPHHPETGKIPVSAMPAGGIRVRTRRVTSKVPIPEKERAPEPISARATPPRPLPEAPAETSTPPTEPQAITVTPPRAELVPLVLPPAESLSIASAPPTVLSEDAPALSGPTMATEPAAPMAGEAAVELPDASVAPEAEARGVAAPDKIRLRRPVKLELSSRAKIQESGRLTLEAFSKMASLDLPGKTLPTDAAPVTATAAPIAGEMPASLSGPGEPISPPGPLATSSPADYNQPRLEEAPPLVWKTSLPKTGWRWEWLAYAFITLGVVALCAIVYIMVHRSGATSAPVVTTSAPATDNETSAPPASAAPPETTTPPAPPAAGSAPAPAATVSVPSSVPIPTKPPSANTAPTASIQDLNRQVETYISDGLQKYQHGDFAGALGADNQALDLNPKSAPALFNRGVAKAAQGDLDGAVADYSAALQIDPNMGQAYYRRGLARHAKAELDGALSDYNQTVQIDPKNAQAFFDRGMIRMQKDDIDGAIVDSTRALELDPRQIQSYYDRGLGRLAKGSMDSALSDMKTFCQLAPQDAYTDYARLYIWLIESQQGQLAEANQELAKAMNNGWNGASTSMVTRIGEFLLGQISENELIKSSASAIPVKDQGQRCEAWYFIGMRRLQAGDKQAAIDDLGKCVDTQKTDYCEYILAQEELKNLSPAGENNAAPSPPRAQPVALPDPGTMTPNAATSDSAPVEK